MQLGMQKSRSYAPSRAVNDLTVKCNTFSCDRPWQVDDTSGCSKRRSFLVAERRRRSAYDKKPQRYTETTEQHIIVRNGKSEA